MQLFVLCLVFTAVFLPLRPVTGQTCSAQTSGGVSARSAASGGGYNADMNRVGGVTSCRLLASVCYDQCSYYVWWFILQPSTATANPCVNCPAWFTPSLNAPNSCTYGSGTGKAWLQACSCTVMRFCTNLNLCCSDTALAAGVCQTQNPSLSNYCLTNIVSVIKGDPHFTGFDGTSYEFVGFAGGIFNLLTSPETQVNARFDSFGWEDTTFVKELGIKSMDGSRIRVASEGPCNGTQVPLSVHFNGRMVFHSTDPIASGYHLQESMEYISALRTEGVNDVINVTTPKFVFNIVKLAGSCHLDVKVHYTGAASGMPLHGVIGQTIQWLDHPGMEFEGDESDYQASRLWADDFKFNLFPDVPLIHKLHKGKSDLMTQLDARALGMPLA